MDIETPFSATFPNSKLRYAAEGVSAAAGEKPLMTGVGGEEMAKLAYAYGYRAGMQELYKQGSDLLHTLPRLRLREAAQLTKPGLRRTMSKFRETFRMFDPARPKPNLTYRLIGANIGGGLDNPFYYRPLIHWPSL